MSIRKSSARSRAFRPVGDRLEDRKLLAQTIRGVDVDGDIWSLTLVGPGVLDVRNSDGFRPDGKSPYTIDTITLIGTDTLGTALYGKVQKAAGGDGKVFFRSMVATDGRGRLPLDPSKQVGIEPLTNGVHIVDMPAFWLGNTDPTGKPLRPLDPNSTSTGSATNPPIVAGIDFPEGVNTLRFGGVDATFNGNATDGKDSRLELNLGVPATIGTSVIVDRLISSAQAASTSTGNPTQDGVYVNVEGRINLFQANSIEGNASLPPSQFDPGSTANLPGGTVLIAGTGRAPFGDNGVGNIAGTESGAIPGVIGNARVGGNATNFTVLTFDATGTSSSDLSKISNFSVGGETNNVMMVAPGGARNIFFGKGMDTVSINTLYINHLQANRGALNSQVTVRRTINQSVFGGDVVNTNVLAGYEQDLINQVRAVRILGRAPISLTNQAPAGSRFTFSPPFQPLAQNGGAIQTRIAGDVKDSVFVASVLDPTLFDKTNTPTELGGPQTIPLDAGVIHAKVEGSIDNSNNVLVATRAADRAFFAKSVSVAKGPVAPPNVPEAPYAKTNKVAPGERRVAPRLQPHVNVSAAKMAKAGVVTRSSVPQGPARRK